ncbi:FemAB family XrtA/PEP-CTERM system-associated protein [Altererythrobacter sp. Root672]|uniref:FemAB family XrtA/PEP-CTERM system-associated protein n=1 Tax=Altererythrobacter sp. Root672 TaxID=1736584 RepID=UPI0006FC2A87|nr:FemAB family XrtA/PEP-CTERM system-associated protein [Altererythrobacter sp. Root672]KRA83498.1 FemAB [Altererythrobacter sp. Root672]
MNAPFALTAERVRLADLRQPDEVARIEGFVSALEGSVFHRPAWLRAIERGTGQRGFGLVAEKGGMLTGWLPLSEVHSPIFGRMLASSGFAVDGGALAERESTSLLLCRAAEELAARRSCTTIELRGGISPEHWTRRSDSHCGFVKSLASHDDAELAAIPRKQRAEVRKGLENDLEITIGTRATEQAAFYSTFSESVRNLGTPVFPRKLFQAVLDELDADILTVRHRSEPVAAVLTIYHADTAMPYWGGGTRAARGLRANDRMYFELMLHARTQGFTRFDFGRSKTGSGNHAYKKNWGFEAEPLTYSSWTAPDQASRDADPTSSRHAARIALWRKLPLSVAARLGPVIARGLG